ncbi:MAG: hypothetical protein Q9195_004894 [Heterodermia aff. obscurata]
MSFGVGVGDLLAVGKLCLGVYTKCKGSPGNYKQLSGEVGSLYAVIGETEMLLAKQGLNPGQQARLATCREGCEDVLKDLDGLLVKYEGLGTKSQRTFDRLAFGSHDMNEIRIRLISNVSMLDAFNNASSHEKLEKKLDMLISEIRAGKREGSVVSTRSFGTAAENKRETWDALRRELEDIGVSPDIITEKRQFIVAWFQKAVAAGRLEEEAPSEEDDDSSVHRVSRSSSGNSDSNSWREISEQSSYDVNNLELPALNTPSRSGIKSPREAITETRPAAEKSVKPPKAQKMKVEKRSRLSVSYLLSKLRSKDGQLLEAAYGGYLDRVRGLLDDGADIEARDKEGATALIIAAEHGHSQIVQLLLDHDANVNITTKWGETALCFAAKKDKNVDMVQMLLDNNADVDAMGTKCRPIIAAAFKGSTAVLQLLIDRGANTEITNKAGRTALHVAANSGRERSVKVLLENNAAIEAKDVFGDTVLMYAIAGGSKHLVKLLLEKGANIEAIGYESRTPLHNAAWYDQEAIARLLVEYGASGDTLDNGGRTPLQLAQWCKGDCGASIAREREVALKSALVFN